MCWNYKLRGIRYMKQLTPKKIVEELDKYIIGQEEAKKNGCRGFKK
ncbi:hypothetical protein TCEA9_16500 [Thermobrachium celere]|nr:hypothetical protein TCEA9_16500 [Thermobrachium celere]